MSARRQLVLLHLAAASLWCGSALAQPSPKPSDTSAEQTEPGASDADVADAGSTDAVANKKHADELFQDAHAALDAGDWATACAKFRESMRYDISVSTQLNIARCREHEGDLVEAWNDYNRARILNRETDDEARRNALGEYLEKSVAALERRLPKVRVVIQRPPAHLTISSDGTPVVQSAAGEPFPINPGEHEIAVAAPGHRTEKRTVTLVEGQALELVFDMVVGEDPDATTDAKPAPAPTPLPDQPPPPPPDDGIAPWAWPVGAVGIVALGAGIGVAVLSVSARSKLADGCTNNGGTFECPDDEFSQNDIDGLVRDANAGLGGALALGGVGIACIAASAAAMAGSSSRESSSTSIRLVPLLARQRGGRLSAGALFESRF